MTAAEEAPMTAEPTAATVTIRPTGDIDLLTAPELRTALMTALASRPAAVEVDLEAVTFLDSTGIAVLVAARKAAARQGTELWVCRTGPVVRMVLDLAGVAELFDGPAADTGPIG